MISSQRKGTHSLTTSAGITSDSHSSHRACAVAPPCRWASAHPTRTWVHK